jgi:hypothetical protein
MPENPKTSKYQSLYVDPDKFVVFNDHDPELRPVRLKLPTPPELRLIDGFGLPPEQQKFQYHTIPPRLQRLSDICYDRAKEKYQGYMIAYMQLNMFWQELNDDQETYKEEIAYIKRVHWHLRYGYWFFCLGKPTWITPWHYFYLNFYYANTLRGKPVDYRDEDRITEIVEWYAYTCTETFKHLDDNGEPIANDNGEYEMVDLGRRVFFGTIHPKRRRKGETMKACSRLLMMTILEKEFHSVIQANTGEAAEDIYTDHLLPAWQKLALFLKPRHDGNMDAVSGVYLKPPTASNNDKHLNSWIKFNNSAKEGVNDRRKLHGILNDESAKVDRGIDVGKRWKIDKLTLAQGQIIHGYCMSPSTVEEMASGGGEHYNEIWNESDFYKRVRVNGQTQSGLLRMFRPTWRGSDGFIDAFGYSVEQTPTEIQLKYPSYDSVYRDVYKGSFQYWTEYYDDLLKDPTKHNAYRLEIRKNPMTSSDCWRGSVGDLGLNYVLIDQRLSELRLKEQTIRGNFKRRGDVVDWLPDPNGKFVVSNLFLGQQNQVAHGGTIWSETHGTFIPAKRPRFPGRFTAGCDPFDYKVSPDKKAFHLSKGGIAVLHNPEASESHLPMKDWESYQLVCWYENRPVSQAEFFEDLLAVLIWYGALVNIESNIKEMFKMFIESGWGGYLWYGTNPDGTVKKDPGTYSGGATKSEMFNALRDFIEFRGHKCKIKEFLQQAKDIRDPKRLTAYDGLAAAGWSIYGSKSTYGLAVERIENDMDFDFQKLYEPPDY